jgi:hypothetical protein
MTETLVPEMYFSAVDPNYRVKGSRDPLGFQVLWANAGRSAIAYLSTVSVNLRDFMILSYGHYFYKHLLPDNNESFLAFFLKFEQACAYARYYVNGEHSFNGVSHVAAKQENTSFSISLKTSDALMSNQRAYGIMGKYIRPFTDMKIDQREEFKSVMETALRKTNVSDLHKLTRQLQQEQVHLTKADLRSLGKLLKTITPEEKNFYRKYILQIPDYNHPQNNLYELLLHNKQLFKSREFHLHRAIDHLVKDPRITDELKSALINIQNTDRILYPIDNWFIHLLNKPHWTHEEIAGDALLNKTFEPLTYTFKEEDLREMNRWLSLPAQDKVENIVARNKEIQEHRGNRAWIISENGYRVVYGETEYMIEDIDPLNDFLFTYFLDAYFSLFKQIEHV